MFQDRSDFCRCFYFQFFLQNAGADGVCHLKQVFLPDKAELGFVAVRKADCQLGRLQRVAKARRLDAVVQHLAVRQYKDLLPRARDPLHIHHDDAVAGEHHLIAHRLVRTHDLLALQQQGVDVFADILLLQADKVLHRFIAEFHSSVPLSAFYGSIVAFPPPVGKMAAQSRAKRKDPNHSRFRSCGAGNGNRTHLLSLEG